MSATTANMLCEFHDALGDARGRGGAYLRGTLHDEEHRELIEAITEGNRAHIARELADVVYVAYGTAHAYAIDLDVALVEIHRAAMRKLDPHCPRCDGRKTIASNFGTLRDPCPACGGTGRGERRVRDDGKILKPEGFVPPDMAAAVR
jgi:predicted HAD superfamily Cof-like phosphohydrolase